MNWNNSSHRLALIAAVLIVAAGVWWYGVREKPAPAADAVGTKAPVAVETAMQENHTIRLETSHGDIELLLFPDKAPKTVENFEKLARSGFYDGTKFHRVIKGFMIQGGDPLTKDDAQAARFGTGGPGYQFDDEINALKVVRGALAMANSGPNTNGSQFFIVTAQAAPWLDGKHTVFGKVVKGMETIDTIEAVETGERDVPNTPVIVKQVIVDTLNEVDTLDE